LTELNKKQSTSVEPPGRRKRGKMEGQLISFVLKRMNLSTEMVSEACAQRLNKMTDVDD